MVKFFVPDAGEYAVDPNASIAELSQLYRQARKRAGIEQPKPEFGLGEIAERSLKRGLEQTKIGYGDLLPAFAASLVGADDYAKRQMEEAAETQEEIARKYAAGVPSYKNVKDIGSGAQYLVEAVGEQIPQLATAIVPGGVGAMIGRRAAAGAGRSWPCGSSARSYRRRRSG